MASSSARCDLLDPAAFPQLATAAGQPWRCLTDGVMGGVSEGALRTQTVAGRCALHLTGTVRLEHNGGFVQAAVDLAEPGTCLDASHYAQLELVVCGNDQRYGVHLRTDELNRPWQSYRQEFFAASGRFETLRLPLAGFAPHRTEQPLDLRRLKRLGLVAIGRAFEVSLAVAALRFVRAAAP